MCKENELKKFFRDWRHFIGCVNFGHSNLDAEAIDFLLHGPESIQKMYENDDPDILEAYE